MLYLNIIINIANINLIFLCEVIKLMQMENVKALTIISVITSNNDIVMFEKLLKKQNCTKIEQINLEEC